MHLTKAFSKSIKLPWSIFSICTWVSYFCCIDTSIALSLSLSLHSTLVSSIPCNTPS